jgi:hypothetical protein
MSTVYRIEIDIRIDNRIRTKVIQTAREDYRKSPFAWTLEDGKPVEISAEEFVVDTKTAFLELAESAFRSVLPDIEPDRFSCGLAEPELKMRPVVPAIPFNHLDSFPFPFFPVFERVCSGCALDVPFRSLLFLRASSSVFAIRSTVPRLRSSRRCWYRRSSRLLCPVSRLMILSATPSAVRVEAVKWRRS